MKKKFFSAVLVASLMTVGCQNEEIINKENDGNITIEASMGEQSRTSVVGTTTYWSEGDKLLAYGDDVLGSLVLQGTGGDQNGFFSGFVMGDEEDLEWLIYPTWMADYNDGEVIIEIGTIDKENSNAPMFAAYGKSVVFENLTGMVRIQINGVPAKNNDLKVKGVGIGKAKFVDGNVTYSKNSQEIVVTGLTEGTNEICIPLFTSNIATAQNVDLTFTLAGASKTLSLPLKKGALTANSVPVLTYDETNKTLNGQTTLPEGGEDGEEGFVISTLTELVQFANMVNAGNNFEGQTVTLGADIDLNNQPWTPIGTGAASDANENIFCGTFDGGNFTISNLNIKTEGDNAAGLFAASLGTIKNLKIEGVNIEANYKAGAVVGDGVTSEIENCHVDGGSIILTPLNGDKGNHAGGIVGYLSAEPSAYVKNCSVNGLEIRAYRDLGGIVGTATGDGGTPVVSENEVTNTVIIADQTAEYSEVKAANAGAICGRNESEVNFGSYTISNVTVETLVATAEQLQNAALKANDGQIIAFANDIEGNAIINQKEDVDVVIDGKKYKFDGTLEVYGHARYEGLETLTIKNIKFETAATSAHDFISCNTVDSDKRYPHNVTVEDCEFVGKNGIAIVGLRIRQGYDFVVKNCVSNDMHSLAQMTAMNGLTFENVRVTGKSGINLLTSGQEVLVKNSEISVEEDEYGVRLDASEESKLTVDNCKLVGGTPIVFRRSNAECRFELTGENTLEPGGEYHIVVESGVEPAMTGVNGLMISKP